MKTSYFFGICSIAYIAPHVPAPAAWVIGGYLAAFAIYHAWKES